MKTLVGVAVFGLVPVPPMPDTVSSSFDGRWTTSEHDLDLSQPVFFPDPVAERMATKDELARIRYELEEIAAKTSTKGPRHSHAGAPAASTLQRAAARRAIPSRPAQGANFCARGQHVAVPSRICSQKRHPDGAMPARPLCALLQRNDGRQFVTLNSTAGSSKLDQIVRELDEKTRRREARSSVGTTRRTTVKSAFEMECLDRLQAQAVRQAPRAPRQ